MAQTGYTPIQNYYSITGGNTPTVGNLNLGEIAINVADQKVYMLNSASNAVVTLVGTLGNQNANSVSITGGSVNSTTIGATTASTGAFTTISASGVITSTVSTGTAPFTVSSTTPVTNLSIGGSAPAGSLTGTTLNSTVVTSSLTTVGTIGTGIWQGTKIGTGYGGTGLTSFTANGVVYASSTSALATGSGLQFDGSNLGVGVTPSAYGSGYKAINIGFAGTGIFSGSGTNMLLTSNWYYNGTNNVYASNGYALGYSQYNGQHQWNVASSGSTGGTVSFTQAMTLDNSGNFAVAQTPGGLSNSNSYCLNTNGALYQSHVSGSGSGYAYNNFGYAGTAIGSITQNGTTGVLYNITSDYRLKENVQSITNAQSVILQLNPVTFDWTSDKSSDSGFIAHEFQSVLPRSVTGTKDGTRDEEYEVTPAVKDEQGNIVTPAVMGTRTIPDYQGMDNSGVIPYLVSAMKELITEINTLKTQVVALQTKVGI